MASGPLGEPFRGRGAVGERAVEAEPAADDDGAGGAGRTEVADEPAEEGGRACRGRWSCSFVHADQGRRPRCRGSCVRCRRADRHAVAGGATTWPKRAGERRCAWRCSDRCGWSSTARPSRCPGPSAARCSRSSRSPRAGPSAWTAWWTPCGRPRCRSPDGRPCTPTSPGCARTSVRRRAGCRPATTATGSTSPPTSSTSRRRGPWSRRPAPALPRRSPCSRRRTRCGAARCSPTSPTSNRSRSRSPPARSCTAR